MIATVLSSTLVGVEGHEVIVEVHVSNGLPSFNIVGLPDAACRESRDRVRSAMLSSGFDWVMRRVTVNLAPPDIRKMGSGLDLAIAIGLLVANEKIPREVIEGMAFIGELSLDGSVRSVHGIVPLVDAVSANTVVVPASCGSQARIIEDKRIHCVDSLGQLVAALAGQDQWSPVEINVQKAMAHQPDIADVRGQPLARWAIEVAAAGGHNILMAGSPGSGKTMLARRLPGLLPELDSDTALVTTTVHSAAGLLDQHQGLIIRPPFRSPHHTSSMISLVGGGASAIRPGEVSLAHGGVLFLDELTEFAPSTLDALREPLEEGVIRVCRAKASAIFPARFLLVGAMNPCPCGEGLSPGACRCMPRTRLRHSTRLSAPLMDRFDIRLIVQRPKVDQLLASNKGEHSAAVVKRVGDARLIARARGVSCNAELSSEQLEEVAPFSSEAERIVRNQLEKKKITARGLSRIRRVALTLADLEGGSSMLTESHISSALELRPEFNFGEVMA